jgi:hypothetical protein
VKRGNVEFVLDFWQFLHHRVVDKVYVIQVCTKRIGIFWNVLNRTEQIFPKGVGIALVDLLRVVRGVLAVLR